MTLGLPGGPVHSLQLGRRSSLPLDWTDRLLGTLIACLYVSNVKQYSDASYR